jgi:NAD(P)-dependent dehydrogenase (short-subunit alcohol dehydrogenase family)
MNGEQRKALVTGGGSGVGRAVALRLAAEGWQVAITGRREEALRQTADLASNPAMILVQPCDISQTDQVKRLEEVVGQISVLVNAAGVNIPARSLAKLDLDDYYQVLATNLHGSYLCIQAFLPAMREQKHGTIINIISEAGLRANAKAGAAYVASKFALSGLNQSINAEERMNGIRACAIYPGDINTPLLDMRPTPPPPEARQLMLQPEDVADCVMLAINLPSRAVIEELLIRPA